VLILSSYLSFALAHDSFMMGVATPTASPKNGTSTPKLPGRKMDILQVRRDP
jgi:hypothetical protein